MRVILEGTSTELKDFINPTDDEGNKIFEVLRKGKFNLNINNVNLYQSQYTSHQTNPFVVPDASKHEMCVMVDLHTDEESCVRVEQIDKPNKLPTISW